VRSDVAYLGSIVNRSLPQSFPYQPPVFADGKVSLSQYGCQSSVEQTTTQAASVDYSCGYT